MHPEKVHILAFIVTQDGFQLTGYLANLVLKERIVMNIWINVKNATQDTMHQKKEVILAVLAILVIGAERTATSLTE